MKFLWIIGLLGLLIAFAAEVPAYDVSGHVGGGEGFPLRWVYAIPTSLDTFFITVCNPFNNNYQLNNLDAGGYLLFAYQDLNTSLTPDLDEPRGFYGGETFPAVLELSSDSEGVDIELSPPNAGGFSGHITYEGTATGATYVLAYRSADFSGLPSGAGFLLDNTGNGDYTAFVDSFGTYFAYAYLDVNANFLPDAGEPYDIYGNQTPAEINIEPTDFPDDIDFTLITLDAADPREPLLPAVVALGNVYPNPFNSSATIPFSLTSETDLRLALYDVLGREVRVIAQGNYSAGEHEVRLGGLDLATGIYYVELNAEGIRVGKRMVLMK